MPLDPHALPACQAGTGQFQTAVIVANGHIGLSASECRQFQGTSLRVIAADGGLRNCLKTGIQPDILVGDMDSVSPNLVQQAKRYLKATHTYPSRKDHTDLELAVFHAVELGATELILLGVLGGRWDMSLSNIMLLMSPALKGKIVRIVDRHLEIRLLSDNDRISLSGTPGDRLSLIPFGQPAEGITSSGLEYPLKNETLLPGSTRGISNVLTHHEATVSVRKGLLLCIHSQAGSEVEDAGS